MSGTVCIDETGQEVVVGAFVGTVEEGVKNLLQTMAKNKQIGQVVMYAAAAWNEVKAFLPGEDGKLCDCPACRRDRKEI